MKIQTQTAAEGLFRRNIILVAGLITAPAAVCTDTMQRALLLCFSFDSITVLTILLSGLVPRKIPYALRILSYSLIAALVYIPTAVAGEFLFPKISLGIYLPLLTVSLLLTSQRDYHFVKSGWLRFAGMVFADILGFDLVILLMGAVRELLGFGTLMGETILPSGGVLPSMSGVSLGIILLGLFAAFAQAVLCGQGKEQSDSDVSAE